VGTYVGEKNKYAGTEYDSTANLNYMQARYQDPQRGQFLSQDPMFLGNASQQNLLEPQTMNSYSYANSNPVVNSDPSGKFVPLVAALIEIAGYFGTAMTAVDVYDAKTTLHDYPNQFTEEEKRQAIGKLFYDGLLFGAGRAANAVQRGALDALDAGANVLDYFFGTQSQTLSQSIAGRQGQNTNPTQTQTTSNNVTYSVPQSTQVSQPYYAQAALANSSAPSIIVQNGVTYVRNSSGLLNIAP
jgi:RHS repeat-associated protein